MIYNLVQYLINNLSSYNFVTNGWGPDSAQDLIMVSETGGEPAHWYDRTDWSVQIISRAKSVTKAKKQIDDVYALIKNRFGLELPEVTVDEIVYPLVKTYQISPIQSPNYFGANEMNMEMFLFNVTIVTT